MGRNEPSSKEAARFGDSMELLDIEEISLVDDIECSVEMTYFSMGQSNPNNARFDTVRACCDCDKSKLFLCVIFEY